MSLTAFMYHDVRDNLDPKFKRRYDLKPFLTRIQFEKQLKYISENYKIISSNDVFNLDIDKRDYAVLTFDDGLVDHFDILNILLKYDAKATFFVPAGMIIENVVMKTIKIQFILSAVDENVIVNDILVNIDTNNRDYIWSEYSKSKILNNWWTSEMIFITNFLRDYDDKDLTKYITDKLFRKYITNNEKEFARSFFLNESQIKLLIQNGMEIGGHGYYSEKLSNLNYIEQHQEIEKTIEFLDELKQDIPLFFSYPNGGYNSDTIDILKKYSCKLSYTTESTIVENLNTIDFLQFPRISAPEKLKK